MLKLKKNNQKNFFKKILNFKRGRFQVFLNLISASQPPITQKAWFDGSEQVRA